MTTDENELERAIREIDAALDKAGDRLKLDAEREALEILRGQVGNWRTIKTYIAVIRSEIIEPVNAQLDAGTKLSLAGLKVGLWSLGLSTVISISLFVASQPWETARDTADIQSRLQRLETMTRTALVQGAPTLASQLQAIVPEGEIEISGGTVDLLQDANGRSIQVSLSSAGSDLIAGVRVLKGYLELREGGRQVAGTRLAEVTGRTVDQLVAGGNRFVVTAGENLTLYGDDRFEVTRVLSRDPEGRDGLADEKTAVYLLKRN